MGNSKVPKVSMYNPLAVHRHQDRLSLGFLPVVLLLVSLLLVGLTLVILLLVGLLLVLFLTNDDLDVCCLGGQG